MMQQADTMIHNSLLVKGDLEKIALIIGCIRRAESSSC